MKRIFTAILLLLFFSASISAQALADGEYLIKVSQTGKFLAVSSASKDKGAWLIQWDNEYTSHFKFLLRHLSNNVYSLQAKHSGKYISTEGAPKRGAKVIQWDWLNQDNQKWIIVKSPGSKFYSISCFQNSMRLTLQHWGASTMQPGNGAYGFITDDISVSQPLFDFKKNEVDQIDIDKSKNDRIQKKVKVNNSFPLLEK